MTIAALHSPSQLRGLSYEKASLYGMPNIGAHYVREDVTCYEHDSYVPCPVCGKPSANVHHEPPRGASRALDGARKVPGAFLLETPMGKFVLLPALICLCGTGTTGCHGDRHSGKLSIRWQWLSEEWERDWWNGKLLSHGLPPNGDWLYDYGYYVFETEHGKFTYRKESHGLEG